MYNCFGLQCEHKTGLTVVPALKTLILSRLPALKTTFFQKQPRRYTIIMGGEHFYPTGPQNHCCGTPAELHRELSAAADATACGYGEIPPVC